MAADVSEAQLEAGLKKLRRRRGFFLALIVAYVPVIWMTLELTGSDKKTGMVFAVWIVLVAIAACMTALCPCPRCRNPFHMNGIVPIYFLRKCLHCGLPLRGTEKSG